jgi:hypothetical protein
MALVDILFRMGRFTGKIISIHEGVRRKVLFVARGIFFMMTGVFPEEEIKDKEIIKENMNVLMRMVQAHKDEIADGRPLPPPFWSNRLFLHGTEPSIREPVSQFCTQAQCEDPCFREWCDLLKEDFVYHRKLWEHVYIMQALRYYGCLGDGKRGLGFGVGREPLPALMARFGCQVIATDLHADNSTAKGWAATGQHFESLSQLNSRGLCQEDEFNERVSYRSVDMNKINSDLIGYDFIWSSCALEHLGSKRDCTDFIIKSLDCLIPGGLAVHTTEFNLSSDDRTLDDYPTVLFRYRDIEELSNLLHELGCHMEVNFSRGTLPFDNYVDFEPWGLPHLNLMVINYVSTSFGIIIRKNN